MTKLDGPLQELREKYQPFGSIFLTYTPLHDLTEVLNDPRRYEIINTIVSSPAIPSCFRTFLKTNGGMGMSDGIAFLQLDLNTRKAGFKKLMDRDGVIRTIAWSEDEVQGIAVLSDTFLNRLDVFEKVQAEVSSGKTTVAKAWKDVQDLERDPFITDERRASLLPELKGLIDRKPEELKRLQDEHLHEAIAKFSTEYDAYLRKQLTDKTLITLRRKNDELQIAWDKLGTTYSGFLTELCEPETLVSLKDNAPAFGELGLLTGLENLRNESIITLHQCLSDVPGKARKTRGKTRRVRKEFPHVVFLDTPSPFRFQSDGVSNVYIDGNNTL